MRLFFCIYIEHRATVSVDSGNLVHIPSKAYYVKTKLLYSPLKKKFSFVCVCVCVCVCGGGGGGGGGRGLY